MLAAFRLLLLGPSFEARRQHQWKPLTQPFPCPARPQADKPVVLLLGSGWGAHSIMKVWWRAAGRANSLCLHSIFVGRVA